jgi:hypothetical protein
MDHSSSSCFEEDEDECPVIIEEVKNFHPDYLRQQSSQNGWNWSSLSVTMGRLLAIAGAFVLISCRLRTMIVLKSDVGLFDDAAPAEPPGTITSSLSTTTRAPAVQPTTTTATTVSAFLTDEQRQKQAQLIEKHGMGPYLVEFQLNIWGEDNRPVEHYFTVELAPSDLMPATVHFFLEQVGAGLWSETSFYENLEHVIVSRPVSGNGQVSKRQLFVDAGLAAPTIAEYSPHFPHAPYTLGLSDGARGEPVTFYINKRHNVHRQSHSHDEACFAQVVVGRSTVDRLAALPGSDAGRIRPVDIKQVRRIQLADLSPRAVQEYLQVKSSR